MIIEIAFMLLSSLIVITIFFLAKTISEIDRYKMELKSSLKRIQDTITELELKKEKSK